MTSKLDIARQTITIRQATPEDASTIARIHVAAWRAAYQGIVPQSEIDKRDYDTRRKQWKRIILELEPDTYLNVAQEDGQVVAFCMHGPRRDKGGHRLEGEIQTLYAHPDVFGRGVGVLLLEEALSQLDKRWSTSVVWAMSANASALRTYARIGFEVVSKDVVFDETPQYVQTMMRRQAQKF